MSFAKLTDIIKQAEERNVSFWEVVMLDDMKERNVSREESFNEMLVMLRAMRTADEEYDPTLRSASGLAGGD